MAVRAADTSLPHRSTVQLQESNDPGLERLRSVASGQKLVILSVPVSIIGVYCLRIHDIGIVLWLSAVFFQIFAVYKLGTVRGENNHAFLGGKRLWDIPPKSKKDEWRIV